MQQSIYKVKEYVIMERGDREATGRGKETKN